MDFEKKMDLNVLFEQMSFQIFLEAKSEFEKLEQHKVPLDPEERDLCMKRDAVWHFSHLNKPTPAVWKSKNPNTGKHTYVTNTHRAYNTASTLKGAIKRYHDFIKGTA